MNSQRDVLDRLAEALVEDILDTSDRDLRAEVKEDNVDPEAVAAGVRALFENVMVPHTTGRPTKREISTGEVCYLIADQVDEYRASGWDVKQLDGHHAEYFLATRP